MFTGQDGGKWSFNGSNISFACRGSSIAKCVEAGYKPWVDPNTEGDDDDDESGRLQYRSKSRANQASHLQACVRMFRADYCGDGTSYTVNGRTVEFWDSMRYQTRTQPSWDFEAAWDENGVRCLSKPRLTWPNGQAPACLSGKLRSVRSCNDTDFEELSESRKWVLSSFKEQGLR